MLDLTGDPPDHIVQIHTKLKEAMIFAVEAAKKYKLHQVEERKYLFGEVEDIIASNPFLVTEFYNGLEPPLSIATSKLCPELVKICIKYGADPMQQFPCVKKGYLKNAHLAAADAYRAKLKKWRKNPETDREYFDLYVAVIEPMRQVAPIAQGASF